MRRSSYTSIIYLIISWDMEALIPYALISPRNGSSYAPPSPNSDVSRKSARKLEDDSERLRAINSKRRKVNTGQGKKWLDDSDSDYSITLSQ